MSAEILMSLRSFHLSIKESPFCFTYYFCKDVYMNDRVINYRLDLLRIYCSLCIIGIHVSAFMSDYSTLAYRILQSFVRPPLWVFLGLTGFFVLGKPITDKIRFVYTHILTLVVPMVIYVLFYHIYYNGSPK